VEAAVVEAAAVVGASGSAIVQGPDEWGVPVV